jgi:hypothetical protein
LKIGIHSKKKATYQKNEDPWLGSSAASQV